MPRCMPGMLTNGFPWSQWRGKGCRHSWRMRNPNFAYLARGPWFHTSTTRKCQLWANCIMNWSRVLKVWTPNLRDAFPNGQHAKHSITTYQRKRTGRMCKSLPTLVHIPFPVTNGVHCWQRDSIHPPQIQASVGVSLCFRFFGDLAISYIYSHVIPCDPEIPYFFCTEDANRLHRIAVILMVKNINLIWINCKHMHSKPVTRTYFYTLRHHFVDTSAHLNTF